MTRKKVKSKKAKSKKTLRKGGGPIQSKVKTEKANPGRGRQPQRQPEPRPQQSEEPSYAVLPEKDMVTSVRQLIKGKEYYIESSYRSEYSDFKKEIGTFQGFADQVRIDMNTLSWGPVTTAYNNQVFAVFNPVRQLKPREKLLEGNQFRNVNHFRFYKKDNSRSLTRLSEGLHRTRPDIIPIPSDVIRHIQEFG